MTYILLSGNITVMTDENKPTPVNLDDFDGVADFENSHYEAFKAYVEAEDDLFEEVGFDMYAQTPKAWEHLSEKIPGLIVTSAGGWVPFQSEGLLQGLPYYLRCRHDVASLTIGQADSNIFEDALFYAEIDYTKFAGIENFEDMIIQLVPLLEKMPFRYEFACKVPEYDENHKHTGNTTDKDDTTYGWGNSPEEAFESLMKPNWFLKERGVSDEEQLYRRGLQKINPSPINEDNRVWPNPLPIFVVKP